jgi:hypothetical protein
MGKWNMFCFIIIIVIVTVKQDPTAWKWTSAPSRFKWWLYAMNDA